MNETGVPYLNASWDEMRLTLNMRDKQAFTHRVRERYSKANIITTEYSTKLMNLCRFGFSDTIQFPRTNLDLFFSHENTTGKIRFNKKKKRNDYHRNGWEKGHLFRFMCLFECYLFVIWRVKESENESKSKSERRNRFEKRK